MFYERIKHLDSLYVMSVCFECVLILGGDGAVSDLESVACLVNGRESDASNDVFVLLTATDPLTVPCLVTHFFECGNSCLSTANDVCGMT